MYKCVLIYESKLKIFAVVVVRVLKSSQLKPKSVNTKSLNHIRVFNLIRLRVITYSRKKIIRNAVSLSLLLYSTKQFYNFFIEL